MTKITGMIIATDIQACDFDILKPYAYYNKRRNIYTTVVHEGGDIIGISKELLMDVHEWALIPLNSNDYQSGQYRLTFIGFEGNNNRTSLFRVTDIDKLGITNS